MLKVQKFAQLVKGAVTQSIKIAPHVTVTTVVALAEGCWESPSDRETQVHLPFVTLYTCVHV